MGNTLLILGNGFDLDLGFRTSYGAFMESQEFRNFQEATYLGKYLFDEQNKSKTWIDIEKELSRYCLEVNQSGLMTPMKTYGRKLLKQEYESLKDALKKYLRKETGRDCRLESSSNALRLLYQIEEYSSNRIVTFNYTELVENISSNAFAPYNHNLLHVHGSLHVEDDIVFGVEDDVVLPKEHAFLYKAYSKYKQTQTFAKWLSEAHNIIFYGYSLGDTDKQYFASFFKDLCRYNNSNRKIVFYHYGDAAYHDLKWQLLSFTDRQLSALEMYNDVQFLDCSKKGSLPSIR